MNKKAYIKPEVEGSKMRIESLMNTDSSGYWDGADAKPVTFDDDLDFSFSFDQTSEDKDSYEGQAEWTKKINLFPDVL